MQESAKPFQMLRWKSIRLRCTRQYALETGQPLLARGLVDGERQMARAAWESHTAADREADRLIARRRTPPTCATQRPYPAGTCRAPRSAPVRGRNPPAYGIWPLRPSRHRSHGWAGQPVVDRRAVRMACGLFDLAPAYYLAFSPPSAPAPLDRRAARIPGTLRRWLRAGDRCRPGRYTSAG